MPCRHAHSGALWYIVSGLVLKQIFIEPPACGKRNFQGLEARARPDYPTDSIFPQLHSPVFLFSSLPILLSSVSAGIFISPVEFSRRGGG